MIAANRLLALQFAARAAVAAVIAVAVAQWVGLALPVYAMIAAIIVTDLSPARTRQLAVARLVGTVLGAAVGMPLASWLDASLWSVGIGVFLALYFAQTSRFPEAARLAGFVCGIVVLEHGGEPWMYGIYRFLETVLGIVVAVGVSLVPKLLREEGFASRSGGGR